MEPNKKHICEQVDAHADLIYDANLYLKDNPEIAFKEYKACDYLSGQLEKNGFHVTKGIGDLETAFLARPMDRDTGGPTVALLAEYDALPKIGHGCGHNMIAAGALGAAVSLKSMMDCPGGFAVIGTPAEEGSGGKAILAEAGVFETMDMALMFHPSCTVNLPGKDNLGRIKFKVEFFGCTAHASGSPDKGRNALDGLVAAYSGFQALRQHLLSDGRIHGIITDGGDAPNVIPDYAAGLFYVRAGSRKYLEELFQRVESCVNGAALTTNTEAKVKIISPKLDPIKRNLTLERMVAANMTELNIHIDSDDGRRGSSDIGNLSHYLPAVHPYLRIVNSADEATGHSIDFREATVSTLGKKILLKASKMLAMTAYDYMVSSDLRTEIKNEFNRSGDA